MIAFTSLVFCALGCGAGTNLEVGGTGPAQSAEKNIFVVPLHFFGSISTISRFGERFRGGLAERWR